MSDRNQPSARERKKRKWDQPSESAGILNLMAVQGLAGGGSFMQGFPPSAGEPGLLPAPQPSPGFSVNAALVQQNAAAIVQKINQDLVARGVLKERLVEEIVSREVVINDTDPAIRTKLIKRQTQEAIQLKTGAVLVTRGRFRPPGAAPEHPGDKPLYLHISSGVHLKERSHVERVRAVDEAVAMVESMIGKNGQQEQNFGTHPPPLPSAGYGSTGAFPPTTTAVATGSHPAGGRFAATVYIGHHGPPPASDAASDLLALIRGPNNEYLEHIQRVTGATIRVRGRGSGNLEGNRGEELPDELHLLIVCATMEGLNDAKKLADNLVQTIKEDQLRFKRESVDHQREGPEQQASGHGSGQYTGTQSPPGPQALTQPTLPHGPSSYQRPYLPLPPSVPPPPSLHHPTPPPQPPPASATLSGFHHPPQPPRGSYPPVHAHHTHTPHQPYPPPSHPYQAQYQAPHPSNTPYATIPPRPALSNPSSDTEANNEPQRSGGTTRDAEMLHTRMYATQAADMSPQPAYVKQQDASQPVQSGNLSYSTPLTGQQLQLPAQSLQPQQATQYSTYTAPPAWTSPPPPPPYHPSSAPSYSAPSHSPRPPQPSYPSYTSGPPPPVYDSSRTQGFGSTEVVTSGSQGSYISPATANPYPAYGPYQGVVPAPKKPGAGRSQGVTGGGKSQQLDKPVPQRRRFQEFPDTEPVLNNQTVQPNVPQVHKASKHADAAARDMPPPPPKAMPPRSKPSGIPSQSPQGAMQPPPARSERPVVVSSTTSKLVDYGEEDEEDDVVVGGPHGGSLTSPKPFWAS